jgi:hypothetical protein
MQTDRTNPSLPVQESPRSPLADLFVWCGDAKQSSESSRCRRRFIRDNP